MSPAIQPRRQTGYSLSARLGVIPLRLPLLHIATVDPILAIISLFLLAALLKFFALLAAVAHDASSSQCKRPSPPAVHTPDRTKADLWAYMWDKMKDWLLHGAIEADEKMAANLASPGYRINRSNLLVLESKADM
jgi:hypothetical protein